MGHSFKLMKLAGSYWRVIVKEKLYKEYMAQLFSDDDLNRHLNMIEEAEKRDHRKIGKQLNLFHLQEESYRFCFLASKRLVHFFGNRNLHEKKVIFK